MKMVVKAAPGPTGDGLTFVLSNEDVDRMGDVIMADGWDLKAFKLNPVALFGHDTRFPVGTWANLRVEGRRLLGDLRLAAKGTSQRIDEIIALVEQGVLRAVSVGFKPLKYEQLNGDSDEYFGPFRYLRQELLETSLVSVPANSSALAVAKGLHISDDTMRLAFGEHADRGRSVAGRGTIGEHAAKNTSIRRTPMKTLSQRIEDAQKDLNDKKDRLAELNNAEDLDCDAIEELNGQIEGVERGLAAMKASEAKLMAKGVDGGTVQAPAIARRPLGFPQREVGGLDLLTRAIVVHGIKAFGDTNDRNKTIDQILDERYPGHEATSIIAKADQTVGTTGTAGWAAELVQQTWAGFLGALTGRSIYPALRDRGMSFSFDGNGTVNIPSRAAGGAGGSFFAEGAPIRVGRVTTASLPMTARQMGVIVPFTRKLSKQSTPSIESVVRQAIVEDTAAVLDPILLDAVAASATRPAGLLNGVAAVATGYGGGDHLAVMQDFKALLAPFIAANAADGITVIMNPAQGLALDFMIGPDGTLGDWFARVRERVSFVESTYATAGRLVALRNSDFATALGDGPMFDVSTQATIHMEDTTPLEIVAADTTVADPVRSLWQTDSIGIRMVMDIGWIMRRSGVVQWVDGTSW